MGTGTLPDDSIAKRLSRSFIPDHRGFPLISNADGGDILPTDPAFCQCAFNNILRVPPYFFRIMLDPAWLGKYLSVFFLVPGHYPACLVKNAETRTGRSLIYCANIGYHIFYLVLESTC